MTKEITESDLNSLASLMAGFLIVIAEIIILNIFYFNLFQEILIVMIGLLIYVIILYFILNNKQTDKVPGIIRSKNREKIGKIFVYPEEFIGSKKTKTYHKKECKIAKSIKNKDKLTDTNENYFTANKFKPCGLCLKRKIN